MAGISGTPISGGTPLAGTYATAHPAPQLPLDVWRGVIGYHPWHFWGMSNSTIPITSSCNTLVREYAWQNADQVGRSEIRRAIMTAEARLAEHLLYFVGRHFVTETIQYPRPRNQGHQFAASLDANGRWLNVRLREGYVRNVGVEAYTTIEAAAAVTYSDEDGDGLAETATVTVSTSVTDPAQLGLYFGASDRLDGAPLSERWRVAPASVVISGGVATFKARKWLFVRPIKYEGVGSSSSGLDPDTAANLVTSVTVARRTCNPDGTTNDTAQALLVWETEPYPSWAIGCVESGTLAFDTNARDPAAVAYGLARVGIRDARLGEITVGRAVYDSSTGEWVGTNWGACRQPDRVIVRYEAGAKLSSVENTLSQARINGRWDEIVARFAAAEMTRRICACDVANQELWHWQFDMARAAGANDEQYRIGDDALGNPFGTRRGAVYAWEAVRSLMLTPAIVI